LFSISVTVQGKINASDAIRFQLLMSELLSGMWHDPRL